MDPAAPSPIDVPPLDEQEPLHVAAARAAVLGGAAGVGGFLALGLFLVLRGHPESLPMAAPAALVFGFATAGAEQLGRRGRRGRAGIAAAALACPLLLYLAWHWIDGLLRGGYELGLERVGRALGALSQHPWVALGWWVTIAVPCLGLALARVHWASAAPARRALATGAVALVGGTLAFVALNALAIGNFREWPERLVLTLGWTCLAGVGLCVGERIDDRWVTPRLAQGD